MDWREVFHKDGSLRDVYIHGTTLSDWEQFVDFIRQVPGSKLSFRWDHEEEIELDLDPRQITESADADRVFEFITALGKRLRKEVHLTEENSPELVLYTPTSNPE